MYNRQCCMCGHRWMGRDDDACPACNDGARPQTTKNTIIPVEWHAQVSERAMRRAQELGLDWWSLTDSHQDGICETVWQEMNWRD